MSDIRIKFEGKRFWIADDFIIIISKFICDEFEKKPMNEYSEGLSSIYRGCDNNRKGENIGMENILFDNYIKSDEDKESLVEIFEEVKLTLQSKGEKIEVKELNEIESNKTDDYFKIVWKKPIYTSSLIATLDIMIKMLKGEWTIQNHVLYYKGFPAPPGVELV